MSNNVMRSNGGHESPFERIRRVNPSGAEFWSSREFTQVLGYSDYRNFEQVIQKARLACFNSGQKVEDHFVDVTEMVDIGSGAQRVIRTVFLSRPRHDKMVGPVEKMPKLHKGLPGTGRSAHAQWPKDEW
jgi:hypothetical protein